WSCLLSAQTARLAAPLDNHYSMPPHAPAHPENHVAEPISSVLIDHGALSNDHGACGRELLGHHKRSAREVAPPWSGKVPFRFDRWSATVQSALGASIVLVSWKLIWPLRTSRPSPVNSPRPVAPLNLPVPPVTTQ